MMQSILRFLMFLVGLTCGVSAGAADNVERNPATLRVVLIGASIGQDWKLPEFPQRMHDTHFQFEALQAWQFDKTDLVEETLVRPSRKFHASLSYVKGFFQAAPIPPDLIILKECSSYFPSDMGKNREQVQRWVREIEQKNKSVMIATSVPVTRARAERDPGKQEAVREFNDWVRAYAEREHLPLLDLEAAVRTDSKDRYLRDELTSGDGTHLNPTAYAILDQVLMNTLCQFDKSRPCAALASNNHR